MPDDLTKLAQFASALTALSRPIINRYFRRDVAISKKEDLSPVTEADIAIETEMAAAIRRAFPSHAILGEERNSDTVTGAPVWVIDPIDGTRSFSTGNPLFATLIAVVIDDAPVVGVIDLPMLDQSWVGYRGGGAMLNGKKVAPSAVQDLAASRITTTSLDALGVEEARRFNHLAGHCLVVNYGGDAANYAHLASGWCDLVVEANLKIYDIMAPAAVISAAGGVVSQWDGAPVRLNDYDGTALVAANPKLHAATLPLLVRN